MIENCLIIPQWIFAVLGALMAVVSIALARYDSRTILIAIMFMWCSVILIVYGLHPYLPCVVVVP